MKKVNKIQQKLTLEQSEELLSTLKLRFDKNTKRHMNIDWSKVQARLEAQPDKLWSLNEMESTGGEPDVVGIEAKTGLYTFFDCAAESPKERRSICYDHEALESRKENKPKDSAIGMATTMGIKILTEQQYRQLQEFGIFDAKTSSWIDTPASIRKLGGAIFADFRYGQVFVYHNGAESYYAARGFRGSLTV